MNEVSLKDLQEEEEHIKDFVRDENKKIHSQISMLSQKLDQLTTNNHSTRSEFQIDDDVEEKAYVWRLLSDL